MVVTNAVYGQDESFFDDALFIGDSRMVNVANYARLGNADYFADVGMTVFKMFSTTASDKDFGATDLASLLRSREYAIFSSGWASTRPGILWGTCSTPIRRTWTSCASSSPTPPFTF